MSAKLGVIDPPQSVAELGEVLAHLPARAARHSGSSRQRPLPPVQPADSRCSPGRRTRSSRRPPCRCCRAGRAACSISLHRCRSPTTSSVASLARWRLGRSAGRWRRREVVGHLPTDLTRLKHCGNRGETGPLYGGSRAAESAPTRPPPRRQCDGASCPPALACGVAPSPPQRATWPAAPPPPRPPPRCRDAGTIRGPRRRLKPPRSGGGPRQGSTRDPRVSTSGCRGDGTVLLAPVAAVAATGAVDGPSRPPSGASAADRVREAS